MTRCRSRDSNAEDGLIMRRCKLNVRGHRKDYHANGHHRWPVVEEEDIGLGKKRSRKMFGNVGKGL